jgi:hypothetical protein
VQANAAHDAMRKVSMTHKTTPHWLLASAVAIFGLTPVGGVQAQDADPLAVTIDGITLDGEDYRSVTITSETPLSIRYSDPMMRECKFLIILII